MNEVNRTLYIPLYGKSFVSKRHIILSDPDAERIWEAEGFPLRGKSKSKWLALNMAMRARVFDDWTEAMLKNNGDALALHIGCGLDSRCERVKGPRAVWIDCDLPPVIELRRRYFSESTRYHMQALDASDPEQIMTLPDSGSAVVILEGLSMYLRPDELRGLLAALREKYSDVHILLDLYTVFGAKASRVKNPVNDVGVNRLYGVDDLPALLKGLRLRVKGELSLTPERLIDQLKPAERAFFKLMFTGKLYGSFYRLYEIESVL